MIHCNASDIALFILIPFHFFPYRMSCDLVRWNLRLVEDILDEFNNMMNLDLVVFIGMAMLVRVSAEKGSCMSYKY